MTSYRRMRRHARQARRAGMQPMMIINPGAPLPDLVIVIIARWAWRHRTAFAPFALTLAAFAVAAYAHPHHPRYWLPVAGMTLLAAILLGIPHRVLRARPAGKSTAGVLARLWGKCGIDRGIERAYAAAVITVTGGWLSAAIAAGPAVKPLPLVAAIATVVLGIPWWFHRRRRAKARAERTIAAWPDVAENAWPGRVGNPVGGGGRVGMDRSRPAAERNYHRSGDQPDTRAGIWPALAAGQHADPRSTPCRNGTGPTC